MLLTLYLLNSFFRSFSGHSLRQALFVYRLIVATLIGNFLMIPSKIKIESFAKRCHMGTLGGKGLKQCRMAVNGTFFILHNCLVLWNGLGLIVDSAKEVSEQWFSGCEFKPKLHDLLFSVWHFGTPNFSGNTFPGLIQQTCYALALGLMHPFWGGCMMVESIACLLTETRRRRFESPRGQGCFKWYSMPNNALNIINI